jgi:hypothetical protein
MTTHGEDPEFERAVAEEIERLPEGSADADVLGELFGQYLATDVELGLIGQERRDLREKILVGIRRLLAAHRLERAVELVGKIAPDHVDRFTELLADAWDAGGLPLDHIIETLNDWLEEQDDD